MIKNIIKNNNYEINITSEYLHILNYIKIEDISFNNIKISLNNEIINIKGTSLIISKLDENELLINGKIKGIDFNNE